MAWPAVAIHPLRDLAIARPLTGVCRAHVCFARRQRPSPVGAPTVRIPRWSLRRTPWRGHPDISHEAVAQLAERLAVPKVAVFDSCRRR